MDKILIAGAGVSGLKSMKNQDQIPENVLETIRTPSNEERDSAVSRGTAASKGTVNFWFQTHHFDGFKIRCSRKISQSALIGVLFRGGKLPNAVYVTPDPNSAFVWSIAFGWSYIQPKKNPYYSTGLKHLTDRWATYIRNQIYQYSITDTFLNQETKKRNQQLTDKLAKEFRDKVRAEVTASGYTVGEMSDMGVGAYETDTHFITVLNYGGSTESDYPKGSSYRWVSAVTKKKLIEKQIRWLIERGVDVRFAEKINAEQDELLMVSIIAGATGTTAPAAQMIVAESSRAKRLDRLIKEVAGREAKPIQKIPSKTR